MSKFEKKILKYSLIIKKKQKEIEENVQIVALQHTKK